MTHVIDITFYQRLQRQERRKETSKLFSISFYMNRSVGFRYCLIACRQLAQTRRQTSRERKKERRKKKKKKEQRCLPFLGRDGTPRQSTNKKSQLVLLLLLSFFLSFSLATIASQIRPVCNDSLLFFSLGTYEINKSRDCNYLRAVSVGRGKA